jgi:hypothetical protein
MVVPMLGAAPSAYHSSEIDTLVRESSLLRLIGNTAA